MEFSFPIFLTNCQKHLILPFLSNQLLVSTKSTHKSVNRPKQETQFLFHLKTVYTIGNCQRSVFSLGVSQHMHKITNLWKFELDRSSEWQDNYERKKRPCHTRLCAFRWLISRPQVLNLRSRNQIRGKLLLSPKLGYFRGSCFSQSFIQSTSPHYSLQSKVLCQ